MFRDIFNFKKKKAKKSSNNEALPTKQTLKQEVPKQEDSNNKDLHEPTKGLEETVPVGDTHDDTATITEERPENGSQHSGWKTAKAAATFALELAEKALDGVPVPGLKAAVGSVLHIMRTMEKNTSNVETLRTLETHVKELRIQVVEPLSNTEEKDLPMDLKDDLTKLLNDLDELGRAWISRQRPGGLGRIIHASGDDADLKEFNEGIKKAIDRFQVSGNLQARLANARQEQALAQIQASINEKTWLELTNNLPRAKAASFNSGRIGAPSYCFAGTRTAILKTITDWLPDDQQPNVFWLNGLAGIGKSTIAMSLSKHANDLQSLGGSFFFSRGDRELSDPIRLFPTLAYQLALWDSSFKNALGEALKSNPDSAYAPAQIQLDRLIIRPLERSTPRRRFVLIVIDALDECSSKDHAAELLKVLLALSTPRIPFILRILITSRPENHIRAIFDQKINIAKCILHDIEASVIRSDIHLYLKEELRMIPSKLRISDLGSSWPKEIEIDSMVEQCGKFFIYAATAIKFIAKDPPRKPQRHLDILLGLRQTNNPKLSPYRELDTLYFAVLRNAFPEDSDDEDIERFRWVVGCIVLLRDPLSIQALGTFTQEKPEEIRDTLFHLHSVIIVPSSSEEAPHLYHPSFRDFLTDRCKDPSFEIVRSDQETRLLLRCLELMMENLTRDVAHIGHYSYMEDARYLKTIADEVLSPEVQYSCAHWASHLLTLRASDPLDAVISKLDEFISVRLLNWFEAMSLLNVTGAAVSIMRDVHRWAVKSISNEHVKTMLYDGYRFLVSFEVVIAKSPMQVYRSALPFTPPETLLYKTYKGEMHNTLQVCRGIGSSWSPRLSTVYGSMGRSIAYSPTAQYFAVPFDGPSVRIFNSISYVTVVSIDYDEKYGEILALCFTSDGQNLISGSENGAMHLWDVISARLIHTFTGHSESVKSLAMCPKSSTFASGSTDGTICVWDSSITAPKVTLQLKDMEVSAVAFLNDESYHLLSGSSDGRIRLWDTNNSTVLRIFEGHVQPVLSLSVSCDGLRFASGSDDLTVKIFSLSNENVDDVITLKGHTDRVVSVAFSPTNPSSLLSGGLDDPWIRLWDIQSQSTVNTFRGDLNQLAFCPDGETFVSAHTDGTFRVWDLKVENTDMNVEEHNDWAVSLIFSPSGSLIATGGNHVDKTAKIWDASTGKLLHTLEGHAWAVYSLAFSADEKKIATGGGDYTARVWDVKLGQTVTVLDDHDNWIKQLDFSPDGSQLITRTDDTTYTWDLNQGGSLINSVDEQNTGNSLSMMYGESKGWTFSMGEAHWVFMGDSPQRRRPVGAVPEEFRISGFAFHSDRAVFTDVSGKVLILDVSRLKKEFNEHE